MKQRRSRVILTLFLGALALGGCYPTPVPTTSVSCPPLGAYNKVSAPGSTDISSAEVFSTTWGAYDPSGPNWCTPGALSVTVLTQATLGSLPTCPRSNGCLNAIDLGPNGLNFSSSNNSVTDRPKLTFDLSAHPEVTYSKSCTVASCFEIYQLDNNNAWTSVGGAVLTTLPTGKDIATGHVSHFSVFAVAELPPPTPPSQSGTPTLVVASVFAEDASGEIDVTFQVNASDLRELAPDSERLFRFAGYDIKSLDITGQVPAACQDIRPLDTRLTCMFPIGTTVKTTIDINSATNKLFTITVDGTFDVKWNNTAILFY